MSVQQKGDKAVRLDMVNALENVKIEHVEKHPSQMLEKYDHPLTTIGHLIYNQTVTMERCLRSLS